MAAENFATIQPFKLVPREPSAEVVAFEKRYTATFEAIKALHSKYSVGYFSEIELNSEEIQTLTEARAFSQYLELPFFPNVTNFRTYIGFFERFETAPQETKLESENFFEKVQVFSRQDSPLNSAKTASKPDNKITDVEIQNSPFLRKVKNRAKINSEEAIEIVSLGNGSSHGMTIDTLTTTPIKKTTPLNYKSLELEVSTALQNLIGQIKIIDDLEKNNSADQNQDEQLINANKKFVAIIKQLATYKKLITDHPFFKKYKFHLSFKNDVYFTPQNTPKENTFEDHLNYFLQRCETARAYFLLFYEGTIPKITEKNPEKEKPSKPHWLTHFQSRFKKEDNPLKAALLGEYSFLGACVASLKRIFVELPILALTYPFISNKVASPFDADEDKNLKYYFLRAVYFIFTPEKLAVEQESKTSQWGIRLLNVLFCSVIGAMVASKLGPHFLSLFQQTFSTFGLGTPAKNFIALLHASNPLIGLSIFGIVGAFCNVVPAFFTQIETQCYPDSDINYAGSYGSKSNQKKPEQPPVTSLSTSPSQTNNSSNTKRALFT